MCLLACAQPTFRSDGYFVCGTEVAADETMSAAEQKRVKESNKLVFSKADFASGCLAKRDDGTTCVWTYPLNEVRAGFGWHDSFIVLLLTMGSLALLQQVRDVEWMDDENAVVAVGQHFALLHVNIEDDAVQCELGTL